MVRIRLRRVGARHQPSYRIVAADKESPRDGRFLENLGYYNPRTQPSTVEIDEARLFHWLKHGAQPSDSVVKVLKPHGTWERWERYKTGEDLKSLLKEAGEAFPEVDPRTRRDDLAQKRVSKKKRKEKEEVIAEAPAETEPVAEEEVEPEAAVEEPSPAVPDVESGEEVVEGEESPEASAEEVIAEVAEGESLEQPTEEESSEEISAEEGSEGKVEIEEEVDAKAVDEAAEPETSDVEEE
jgi:small subunit ribosomal protein S16